MQNKFQTPTPFIRAIPNSGGAFYTFTSASEDLTLSFSDFSSDRKFRFSKFALLDIPNISNKSELNTIKLQNTPSTYDLSTFNKTNDKNIHFIHSFQNYCLNLESSILNDTEYKCELDDSVSERVFFKWLKELGAIRFVEAEDKITSKVLYNEEINNDYYNSVVKYIGDISYSGTQIGNNNTYTEIYMHIPSKSGNTPRVLFNIKSDSNYNPGKVFSRIESGLNNEIICGRKYDDIHPDGLDIRAHYDFDEKQYSNSSNGWDESIQLYKKRINNNTSGIINPNDIASEYELNKWWFDTNKEYSNNSYLLEPLTFTDASNDCLAIYRQNDNSSSVNELATRFKRSRLDGICIDFNLQDYFLQNNFTENKSSYNTIGELSYLNSSSDFEFNAVLLYYDIYTSTYNEQTDLIEETIKATNLFGVLFLDNVSNLSNGEGEIKRFFKQKANDAVNISGNEYAFKINLKVDNSTSSVSVTHIPVISENNTIAMNLFHEALVELLRISDMFESNNLKFLSYEQKLQKLEHLVSLNNDETIMSSINSILKRLSDIEKINNITDNGISTYENGFIGVFELYQELKNQLNSLLINKLSAPLALDFSTIRPGQGINLEVNESNMIINANTLFFNYTDQSIINFNQLSFRQSANANENMRYFIYDLVTGANYIRIEDNSIQEYISPNKLVLYINNNNNWKKGQIVRLSIVTPIRFSGYESTKNLTICTNSNVKSKEYDTEIYKLTSDIFEKKSSNVVLEIHCLDDINLKFFVDIL